MQRATVRVPITLDGACVRVSVSQKVVGACHHGPGHHTYIGLCQCPQDCHYRLSHHKRVATSSRRFFSRILGLAYFHGIASVFGDSELAAKTQQIEVGRAGAGAEKRNEPQRRFF